MTGTRKLLLTSMVLLLALGVLVTKYWSYVINPWTRDGQVRAQVIQITPRVTGPIVKLTVSDNQFVTAGELLFQIDPRTFATSLMLARAELDKSRDDIEALGKQVEASLAIKELRITAVEQSSIVIEENKARVRETKAQFKRAKELVPKGAMSQRALEAAQANYEVAQAKSDEAKANVLEALAAAKQAEADLAKDQANLGAHGELNPRLRSSQAKVREAELNLEFTQVRAPVDGYVTNLNLRVGSQAIADQAALALIDINSFWVHGFFRENYIEPIRAGDRAVVTLMTYPDTPLEGRVESLGWGIAQDDGSVGDKLLPSISPTFEWIRLAQRVPVRVRLLTVPDTIKLRVGTTASVMVMTGASGNDGTDPVVAAPRALQ
ncbi:MAG: HlyD family secretion protein [Gammaproteobacteria bacterium]|nr:HlyD family secretion protein [Gammaproteobacteria bacterium]